MLSKQLFIIISIIIYQSFVGYLGLGWLWMDGWQLSGRRKGFMLRRALREAVNCEKKDFFVKPLHKMVTPPPVPLL